MEIDGAKQILEFLDRYGVSLVITAIFIIQTVRSNKRMDDIARKNEDIINRIIDGKFAGDASTVSQTESEKGIEHAEQDEFLTKINMRKIEIMNRALEKSRAQRVGQFAYHNNAKDYLGRSFQRMSCENEVTAPGVIGIQNKYNNIFRTFTYFIYKNLNVQRAINICNMETLKDIDAGFYETLIQDNIHALYVHSIQNEQGHDVGYVAFAFDKAQSNQELPHIVEETAYQLQSLNYKDV